MAKLNYYGGQILLDKWLVHEQVEIIQECDVRVGWACICQNCGNTQNFVARYISRLLNKGTGKSNFVCNKCGK